MRRDRTFATLLSATAALVLSMEASAAGIQERKQVGEICIQQNGVYLANVRINIHEHNGRGFRINEKNGMAIGQTHCTPFLSIDERAFVVVDVVFGHTKRCEFSLEGRSGRQTVTASGTSLNVGLACP
ncbi:MAG TPA: hypothetical protein VD995_20460 [Azospirillum sp.]|nr:hypothetical protein [Azospirillum sp.]